MVAALAPDYAINLAGISFVQHGDLAEIYAVNTVGAINLLQALVEHTPTLRRVVLISSANVYGNAAIDPIDETAPLAPVGHYGCSKLSMEFMARAYFDRLPVVILRAFNYTGVGQSRSFLVPKIVWHFASQASRIELGNVNVVRDFSDVRMVATAYSRLLSSPLVGTQVNICSGTGRSLQSIVETLRERSGHSPAIEVDPALVRAAELKRLVGGNTRLLEATGALPYMDFGATLAWMLDSAPAPSRPH